MKTNKTNICGLLFDNVTKEEATDLLTERLERGERTVVFTPNAEILGDCMDDSELMDIVSRADVILPDGIGVIKAAKTLGVTLKEKVPGVEVGEMLMRRLSGTEHRVFILGGKAADEKQNAVAHDAALKMNEKYGTDFAGWRDGYFEKTGSENDAVIDGINASGADVLIVCLGFPAQEKWIVSNIGRLPEVKLALALGGSADVWAGRVNRAPRIFIKLGLEWFWRLLRQPSRIGRVMKLPLFLSKVKRYKKQTIK
ncbi:MAG: WecB/TagA/CpsF family glycosyltransferase [Clostridia bacterium]|nr:WecB/TagA/CpsF family glycosyltransferase [Clostridia bacterium]